MNVHQLCPRARQLHTQDQPRPGVAGWAGTWKRAAEQTVRETEEVLQVQGGGGPLRTTGLGGLGMGVP